MPFYATPPPVHENTGVVLVASLFACSILVTEEKTNNNKIENSVVKSDQNDDVSSFALSSVVKFCSKNTVFFGGYVCFCIPKIPPR